MCEIEVAKHLGSFFTAFAGGPRCRHEGREILALRVDPCLTEFRGLLLLSEHEADEGGRRRDPSRAYVAGGLDGQLPDSPSLAADGLPADRPSGRGLVNRCEGSSTAIDGFRAGDRPTWTNLPSGACRLSKDLGLWERRVARRRDRGARNDVRRRPPAAQRATAAPLACPELAALSEPAGSPLMDCRSAM